MLIRIIKILVCIKALALVFSLISFSFEQVKQFFLQYWMGITAIFLFESALFLNGIFTKYDPSKVAKRGKTLKTVSKRKDKLEETCLDTVDSITIFGKPGFENC
jgi:hypothetical protein